MGTREAAGTLQISALGTIKNILSDVSGDFSSAQVGEALAAIQLSTGVEANQMNRGITKRKYALASGEIVQVDVYDLAALDVGGGAGKDGLGQAVAQDEAVMILVVLKAGSAGALRIGGNGTGAAWNSIFDGNDSAKTILRASTANPGIFLLFTPSETGYAIEDATNHLLQFEAVGGTLEFALHLWARDNP